MENYYELLEVLNSASTKEIIMAYENKITKFNNLNRLSRSQINEIKLLKSGLYILTNDQLRNKYNQMMGIKGFTIKNTIDSTINNNFNPAPENLDVDEQSLDSLFNIDNSWMRNHNFTSDNGSRKIKNKNEGIINSRVFSLSDINKRPGFSSDFEAELRKPQQGREDKTELKMSKNNTENN